MAALPIPIRETLPPVYSTRNAAERVAKTYLARPSEPVYFDLETTGLDPRTNLFVMAQLKQGTRSPVIFDLRGAPERLLELRSVFEELYLIGHNLKFDLGWLRALGIRVGLKNKVYDTQIAEQLIHGVGLSEAKALGLGVNLEDTATRYGLPVSKEERNWFIDLNTREEEWKFDFPEEQVLYGAQDVNLLGPIYEAQTKELKARGLGKAMRLEMRTLPALVEMEHAGIHINVEGWREFIHEKDQEAKAQADQVLEELGTAILNRRIQEYDKQIVLWNMAKMEMADYERELREEYDYVSKDGPMDGWGAFKKEGMAKYRAGHVIPPKPKLDLEPPNINSQKQLIAGLEALGIPVPTKRNEKGQVVQTTESKALEPLALQYPMIARLLEERKARKFVTSFGDTLLEFVDPNDRIHSDYNQIGAGTGRMSCTRPNFQQIPSKGDGHRIRELVTAPKGYVLLTADFSNIELRVLANLTGAKSMCAAFDRGLDLHSETARLMFKLPPDVDPKKAIWKRDLTYRQIAKIINFMLVYGGSPFKLSMEIGVSLDEATALVEAYFEAYPEVKAWMDRTRREVWRTLKSETMVGRQRKYEPVGPEPDLEWFRKGDRIDFDRYNEALRGWKKARAQVERKALNSPIQGTAADITKLALALFYERSNPERAHLVACVHDELVVEARNNAEIIDETERLLKDCMKQACDTFLKVSPVPAPDVAVADHWVKE